MKSPWVDRSVPSLGQGWVWYFSLRKRIAPLPDTVLPAYGCAQGVGAFARTRWGIRVPAVAGILTWGERE